MTELTHLREYTKELKKRLPRDYFKPVPTRLLWLIPHLGAIGACIWLLTAYDLPVWVKLGISLMIGLSFSALGFLAHEVLHGSVVRTPFVRDTVGAICFAPFALGPKIWRKWHNVEHHGHTQGDQDPDAMGTLEDFHNRRGVRALYSLHPQLRSLVTFVAFSFWFTLHAFLMLVQFYPSLDRRDRVHVVLQFALPVACWTLFLIWFGWDVFLYAYVIPHFVANFTVMSYIATNHMLNPLTPVNDPLANSLTVTKPRWVDVLHLNFSHHTEHHVFPAMNPKYAPKVKALMKELWPERYNEMPHWRALQALWRTPRLYRNESELADPKRKLAYPVLGRGMVVGESKAVPYSDKESAHVESVTAERITETSPRPAN